MKVGTHPADITLSAPRAGGRRHLLIVNNRLRVGYHPAVTFAGARGAHCVTERAVRQSGVSLRNRGRFAAGTRIPVDVAGKGITVLSPTSAPESGACPRKAF